MNVNIPTYSRLFRFTAAALVVAGSNLPSPSNAEVVAEYSFEGNLNDTATGGGTADNLTYVQFVSGSATPQYIEGVGGGQAALFDGNHFTAPNSPDLELTDTTWTIEAFVHVTTSNGEWHRLVLKWDNGGMNYHFALRNQNFDVFTSSPFIGNVFNRNTAPVTDFTDGWHHLAVTSSDTGSEAWVDGVSVFTGGPLTFTNTPGTMLALGNSAGSSATGFNHLGWMDEIRIHNDTVDQAYIDSRVALLNPPLSRPEIVDIQSDPGAGFLTLSWTSQSGKVYDILSTTDPSVDPNTWPVVAGEEGLAATPPTNMRTIAMPVDPKRFYVIQERPAPPLFFDDFETDKGWSVGTNGGDTGTTVWERGAPAADGFGPDTGVDGSTNCFGTNLTAFYGSSTDIYLRSPEIDLSGLTGATLSMAQFLDNDSFDPGTIRVLKSSDLSDLGVVAGPLWNPKFDTSWDEFAPMALPAAALGEKIVLEFQFVSDGSTEFDGWYIDDVAVHAN